MNQKGFVSLIGLILIVVVIIAGVAYMTGKGSGNVIEADREVADFNRISLSGMGNLIITQGEEEGLRIEAEDNILDKIITEVKSDTLEIKYKTSWLFFSVWPTEDVNYYIDVKNLEHVMINGSGSVTCESLTADTFGVEVNGSGKANLTLNVSELTSKISGSGDFTIMGTATDQSLDISGAGKYMAKELVSKKADINISGSGTAEVNTEEELDVKISGSGTVRYLGTPTINQEISGSGKIERLEE